MRQFPCEGAAQFQTFKNQVSRIEKIRAQLPISFDHGPSQVRPLCACGEPHVAGASPIRCFKRASRRFAPTAAP